MQTQNINVLALAYLGDAIYEIYIREYLLNKNIVKVKELQEEAIKYVSAKSQSEFLKKIIENNFLNEEEIAMIKRADRSDPRKCSRSPVSLRIYFNENISEVSL
mgnify:CR=1 FL=1